MKKQIPIWIISAFLLLSFLGFIDATYLTIEHYSGDLIDCNILKGCNEVTQSPYSVVAGIPVALLGSIYYLAIFVLSLLFLDKRQPKFAFTAAKLTILGLFASLWFTALQAFVIKAYCQYCLFSAIISAILFALGLGLLIPQWKSNSPKTENKVLE